MLSVNLCERFFCSALSFFSKLLYSLTTIIFHTGAKPTAARQRTVVFMKFTSQYGQQVFIRGGIDEGQRPGLKVIPVSDIMV